MKVVVYNAVSLDGFIARLNSDSDWAVDDEEFEAEAQKAGCIIIGRKTFEQYQCGIYPMPGLMNFVYTGSPQKFASLGTQGLQFVGPAPQDALKAASQRGFDRVILAGGSQINGSFAAVGVIDEIILDVHPLMLGRGINLLGDRPVSLELELVISQNNPKGFVQNHYKQT